MEVDVTRVLRNATIRLIHEMPFYGHVLSQLPKVFSDEIGTMGVGRNETDMLVSLYVSPSYITAMYEEFGADKAFEHVKQVLKHEVLHIVFNHLQLAFPDSECGWIACDMSVNSYLDTGKLLDTPTRASDKGYPERLSAMEYYQILMDEKQQQQQEQQQESGGDEQSGDGQGSSGQNEDKDGDNTGQGNGQGNEQGDEQGNEQNSNGQGDEQGQGNKQSQGKGKEQGNRQGQLDSHDSWKGVKEGSIGEMLTKDIIRKAKDAVEASSTGWGNTPGEITEAIDAITKLKEPIVPWQVILKEFVSSSTETVLDYTNKRPSKRFGTRPGTYKKAVANIAIGVDTSGSIDTNALEMFFNELYWISREDCELTVFECDTEIRRETPFKFYDIKDVVGRGGTDLEPVIKEAAERKFDALIYFTDAEASKVKNKYNIPIMLVLPETSYHDSLDKLPVNCLWALKAKGNDVVCLK